MTTESVALARMSRIEDAISLLDTLIRDFDVTIKDGRVRIVSLTGKKLTPALRRVIREHFDALAYTIRADLIASGVIERARNATPFDVPTNLMPRTRRGRRDRKEQA